MNPIERALAKADDIIAAERRLANMSNPVVNDLVNHLNDVGSDPIIGGRWWKIREINEISAAMIERGDLIRYEVPGEDYSKYKLATP